jgi:hypothetical protein
VKALPHGEKTILDHDAELKRIARFAVILEDSRISLKTLESGNQRLSNQEITGNCAIQPKVRPDFSELFEPSQIRDPNFGLYGRNNDHILSSHFLYGIFHAFLHFNIAFQYPIESIPTTIHGVVECLFGQASPIQLSETVTIRMSDSPSDSDSSLPKYFSLLSEADQARYLELKTIVKSNQCPIRRGHRLESFKDDISSIREFCLRYDGDDWKRCAACGICWLPIGVAINNHQLSILLEKCKSSINGCLQKIGYSAMQSRTDSSGPLSDALPVLKDNLTEQREWTVRLFGSFPAPPPPLQRPSRTLLHLKVAVPFQPRPSPPRVFIRSHVLIAQREPGSETTDSHKCEEQ